MIALDTETWLIEEGRTAPLLVCLTAYPPIDGRVIWTREEAKPIVEGILRSNQVIVGHNIAFDLSVIGAQWPDLVGLLWDAYNEGRVRDTGIREQLYAIATDRLVFDPDLGPKGGRPTFSLAELVGRYFGRDRSAEKKAPDAWRLRYAELDGVPLEEWPEAAVSYAVQDAEDTYRVFQAQEVEPGDDLRQVRYAWAFRLMEAWGLRTDQRAVQALRSDLEALVEVHRQHLLDAGVFRPMNRKGKFPKNMQVIRDLVMGAFGSGAPVTESGAVSTSSATLRECFVEADGQFVEGCEVLYHLSSQQQARDELDKFLPRMTPIVHPRIFLTRTGRTSSRPNVQNPPRRPGVRECFVPRPGFVYLDADYSVAELCSLAEICKEWIGFSKLGEAISEGLDPHLLMGAEVLGVSYAQMVSEYEEGSPRAKDARQLAKALSFGYPGGLGAATFCTYARDTWGVIVTESRARELKSLWMATFPEMRIYFELVAARGPSHQTVGLRSGRVRGGVSFTNGCNTPFQGLTSDGAKSAVYEVQYECYTPGSCLYGSRVVNFIHDEILLESPEPLADECGKRLEEIMISAMSWWVRSVPIRVDARRLERWCK